MSSIQWQQHSPEEAVNLSTNLGTDMTEGSALIAHTVPGNHCVFCSQLFAVSIDLVVTPMSKRGKNSAGSAVTPSWGSASCVAGAHHHLLLWPILPSQGPWSPCCCIYSPAVNTDCSQQCFVVMPWALTSDGSGEDTSIQFLCRGNCWKGSVDVVGERELCHLNHCSTHLCSFWGGRFEAWLFQKYDIN